MKQITLNNLIEKIETSIKPFENINFEKETFLSDVENFIYEEDSILVELYTEDNSNLTEVKDMIETTFPTISGVNISEVNEDDHFYVISFSIDIDDFN